MDLAVDHLAEIFSPSEAHLFRMGMGVLLDCGTRIFLKWPSALLEPGRRRIPSCPPRPPCPDSNTHLFPPGHRRSLRTRTNVLAAIFHVATNAPAGMMHDVRTCRGTTTTVGATQKSSAGPSCPATPSWSCPDCIWRGSKTLAESIAGGAVPDRKGLGPTTRGGTRSAW